MHDIDQRVNDIATAQHGTFTAWQLSGLSPGIVRHRVSAGRWIRYRPGVFIVAGTPDTWERRLWLALLVAGEGAVVGRRSAARVLGLTRRWEGVIDVVQPETSTPRGKPRTSRRTSLLPQAHLTTVDGFTVTTVERTLFDLAGLTSAQRRRRGWIHVREAQVERLVDDALVGRRTTITALARTLIDLAGRGRPGTVLMRRILDERSGKFTPTESELEDLFIEFVDRYGLPRPRRQVTLGSDSSMIGRVDFLFEAARVVVEVDSRAFHMQLAVQRQDHRRDLLLLKQGLRVIRLGWRDIVEGGVELATLLRSILEADPV